MRGPPAPRRLVSTGREVRRSQGLHTLYISPLKALAVDIARNLEIPVREMGLAVKLETRTGDTPASKRQTAAPLSARHSAHHAGATGAAAGLGRRALSVRHAQARRARRTAFAGDVEARRSAVARSGASVRVGAAAHAPSASPRPWPSPNDLARFLVPQPPAGTARADIVVAQAGAQPLVTMLDTRGASALGRSFGAPRARRNLRS